MNGNPVDGHAGEVPPYALSQAKKKDGLAKLRELEYRQRSGDLIRTIDGEALIVGALLWFIEERRFLPGRLRESLHHFEGAQVQRILEAQLEHCVVEFGRRLRRAGGAHQLHTEWLHFIEWRQQQTGAKPS